MIKSLLLMALLFSNTSVQAEDKAGELLELQNLFLNGSTLVTANDFKTVSTCSEIEVRNPVAFLKVNFKVFDANRGNGPIFGESLDVFMYLKQPLENFTRSVVYGQLRVDQKATEDGFVIEQTQFNLGSVPKHITTVRKSGEFLVFKNNWRSNEGYVLSYGYCWDE